MNLIVENIEYYLNLCDEYNVERIPPEYPADDGKYRTQLGQILLKRNFKKKEMEQERKTQQKQMKNSVNNSNDNENLQNHHNHHFIR